MRETTYTCDKCGKKMKQHCAVRVNLAIVEEDKSPVKKPYDFCPDCFSVVKAVFFGCLHDKKCENLGDVKPVKFVEVPMENGLFPWENDGLVQPNIYGSLSSLDDSGLGTSDNEPALKSLPDEQQNAVATENQGEVKDAEQRANEENQYALNAEYGRKDARSFSKICSDKGRDQYKATKFGTISQSEKEQIYRMYLVEHLDEYEIAKKLSRVPRGIKRAITAAKSTGELESLRAIFCANESGNSQSKGPDAEENCSSANDGQCNSTHEDTNLDNPVNPCENDESSHAPEAEGSEATSSKAEVESEEPSTCIALDSYTKAPLTEVIEGKKYDVGGILALARAGWSTSEIAKEKHYFTGVVEMICNKYRNEINTRK